MQDAMNAESLLEKPKKVKMGALVLASRPPAGSRRRQDHRAHVYNNPSSTLRGECKQGSDADQMSFGCPKHSCSE